MNSKNKKIKFRCDYCKSTQAKILFSVKPDKKTSSYYLYQCLKCHLVSTFPRRIFNQHYSENYQAYRSPITGQRFPMIIDRLVKLWRYLRSYRMEKLVHGGKVIDVGCGQAIELQILKKRGVNVVGFEYDKKFALAIHKNTGIKMYHGDFKKAAIPSHSFQLISFLHSLEHIPQPHLVIKKAKSLLEQNGYLLISVPNFTSQEARFFGSSWFHLDIPRHLYHFSKQWLIRLLQKNGFEIIYQKMIAPEYDYYSILQSTLNWLFRNDQNLLYRLLLREQKNSASDYVRLIPQVPYIIVLSILAAPITFLLWLTGGSGTIELVAQKNDKLD